MTVFTINGLDHTDDKHKGAMRWVDALGRSKEAEEKFPGFTDPKYTNLLSRIQSAVVGFINGQITMRRHFVVREDYPNTTYYQNFREKLDGGGPGTAMKFVLSGYCNWSVKEAAKLDAILNNMFPGMKLSVGYSRKGKPECIIHIPL